MAFNYVNGPADGISTDNALVRWDLATGRLVQNSVNGPYALDTGLLGLATTAPTHSLTLANTATGIALNNTADPVTNFERFLVRNSGNVFQLFSTAGGTGVVRGVEIGSSNATLLMSGATGGLVQINGTSGGIARLNAAGGTLRLDGLHTTSTTIPCVQLATSSNMSASSGTQTAVLIDPTVNQTGTAAYKALRVNVTETGTGSGQKDFLSLEVAATQRARIGNNGNPFFAMATAIPAGGAASTGVFFSSTAGFGTYFGSGAPTVSAAKGSLYLRSDGSGTSDRAYVNTDGGTTWTALQTAA